MPGEDQCIVRREQIVDRLPVAHHIRDLAGEYFEDGVKVCDMERFEGKDPLTLELYKDPSSLKRSWVQAVLTQNLFRAAMSRDAKSREVRVTDRFGNVYSEYSGMTDAPATGEGTSGAAPL